MGKKAVVLSGGGSKGSYQVGVWKALRKLHYKYQIVTGTSVGALNGILMVQREYQKCLKLWENINFNQLFTEEFPEEINGILGHTKLYKKYATNFIKNGGMDTSKFEQLVMDLYNPFKFFHSTVDYGTVTYNLTSRKVVEITKKDMNEQTVPLYAVASASCYPAFQKKKINGESYIDGGYIDNVPIRLAIELGATELVVVDLNAIGRKRKVNTEGIKITRIEPKNQIVSFLVFQEELSKKAIQYGYNDTLKAFGKLEGNSFTFYKNQLQKEYLKNGALLKEEVQNRLGAPKPPSLFLEQLMKLSFYHKLACDQTGEKIEQFFYEMIELIGKNLRIEDTKIYRMKEFQIQALKALATVDTVNLKHIEEKIKQKKVRSLFGTSTILRYLYDHTKKIPKTKREKNEYYSYALLFPKEFIAAIYLHILNDRYKIMPGGDLK